MVGQGTIIAAGAIAYPPGFAHAPDSTFKSLGDRKSHDDDLDVRSSRHSRRAVGRVSSSASTNCSTAPTVSTKACSRTFGLTAGVRGDAVNANARRADARPRAATSSAIAANVAGMPSEEMLRAHRRRLALVSAYRRHGHLAATLDPLGTLAARRSVARSANYNLTPAMMSAVPASVLRVKVPGNTLADVLPNLQQRTTARTIAYEIEHISNIAATRMAARVHREARCTAANSRRSAKSQVLKRLTKVETMERYFRKQFMSQKTFSIEGLDVMVPMLEETISMLAEDGTQTAVLGMAHRGRLSTIAHVVNRPYEELLAEFEAGAMKTAEPDPTKRRDRRREISSRRGRHVRSRRRHEDQRSSSRTIPRISKPSTASSKA